MFAITATAILWAWAASGVILELVGILLPRAFGWSDLIDAALGRTLFSVTLHAIVYFWLMPAYIAFYTLVPLAAGGRLYSDTMGRLAFIMFFVFSLPVGMHHLFMDPEHGSGFKFLQSSLTFLVVLPTLLTVFSICASLEIAGRIRGGRGLLGWIRALPWNEPMVLAVGLSLVMLGLGGFGGLINMSYAMNAMIHNTSWVTAHFHLIFGGAVVIMYFAIAYEMWPRITGKPLRSKRLACAQLWLWFWGMLITTIPWHIAGLMGQPRRVAAFDYADPLMARMGPLVVISVIGGVILLGSAILLIVILARSHFGARAQTEPLGYAIAVNPPVRVTAGAQRLCPLERHCAVLMILAYGYPIGQFFFMKQHSVPAVAVTGRLIPAGDHNGSRARRFKLANPWPRIAWGSMAMVFIVSFLIGFFVLGAIPAKWSYARQLGRVLSRDRDNRRPRTGRRATTATTNADANCLDPRYARAHRLRQRATRRIRRPQLCGLPWPRWRQLIRAVPYPRRHECSASSTNSLMISARASVYGGPWARSRPP